MINELARFPTRSDNVYFASNKQASIRVFTAVFCFTHAEHRLIKLKLYNKWSAQAGNSVLCEIQRNQSNLLSFKNYLIGKNSVGKKFRRQKIFGTYTKTRHFLPTKFFAGLYMKHIIKR